MNDKEFQLEIKELMDAYPGTPPGRNWPRQRIEAFYNAFRTTPHYIFRKACAAYIGTKFNPPGVPEIKELVEQMSRDEGTGLHLSAEEFEKLHPIQANAKELADKYGGNVIRLLRGGSLSAPLPYDPSKRINSEEEMEGA